MRSPRVQAMAWLNESCNNVVLVSDVPSDVDDEELEDILKTNVKRIEKSNNNERLVTLFTDEGLAENIFPLTHIHIHTHVHTYTHTYKHTRVRSRSPMHTHTHAHTHAYTHMCNHTHTYMHTLVHTRAYTHKHTHKHKFTRTNTRSKKYPRTIAQLCVKCMFV